MTDTSTSTAALDEFIRNFADEHLWSQGPNNPAPKFREAADTIEALQAERDGLKGDVESLKWAAERVVCAEAEVERLWSAMIAFFKDTDPSLTQADRVDRLYLAAFRESPCSSPRRDGDMSGFFENLHDPVGLLFKLTVAAACAGALCGVGGSNEAAAIFAILAGLGGFFTFCAWLGWHSESEEEDESPGS